MLQRLAEENKPCANSNRHRSSLLGDTTDKPLEQDLPASRQSETFIPDYSRVKLQEDARAQEIRR